MLKVVKVLGSSIGWTIVDDNYNEIYENLLFQDKEEAENYLKNMYDKEE